MGANKQQLGHFSALMMLLAAPLLLLGHLGAVLGSNWPPNGSPRALGTLNFARRCDTFITFSKIACCALQALLDCFLAPLGALVDAFWDQLGASWAPLGPNLGPPGLNFGSLGRPLD